MTACTRARTATRLRRMEKRWALIWMDRRTTRGSTRWRQPQKRDWHRKHGVVDRGFGDARRSTRVGFMSQVSPDGRSSDHGDDPSGLRETTSITFLISRLQISTGLLSDARHSRWYDRTTKKLQPLPGADDPQYIQSNAVWSPDGKYIVFSGQIAGSLSAEGGHGDVFERSH